MLAYSARIHLYPQSYVPVLQRTCPLSSNQRARRVVSQRQMREQAMPINFGVPQSQRVQILRRIDYLGVRRCLLWDVSALTSSQALQRKRREQSIEVNPFKCRGDWSNQSIGGAGSISVRLSRQEWKQDKLHASTQFLQRFLLGAGGWWDSAKKSPARRREKVKQSGSEKHIVGHNFHAEQRVTPKSRPKVSLSGFIQGLKVS